MRYVDKYRHIDLASPPPPKSDSSASPFCMMVSVVSEAGGRTSTVAVAGGGGGGGGGGGASGSSLDACDSLHDDEFSLSVAILCLPLSNRSANRQLISSGF